MRVAASCAHLADLQLPVWPRVASNQALRIPALMAQSRQHSLRAAGKLCCAFRRAAGQKPALLCRPAACRQAAATAYMQADREQAAKPATCSAHLRSRSAWATAAMEASTSPSSASFSLRSVRSALITINGTRQPRGGPWATDVANYEAMCAPQPTPAASSRKGRPCPAQHALPTPPTRPAHTAHPPLACWRSPSTSACCAALSGLGALSACARSWALMICLENSTLGGWCWGQQGRGTGAGVRGVPQRIRTSTAAAMHTKPCRAAHQCRPSFDRGPPTC